MEKLPIGILVGSQRKASISKQIALYMQSLLLTDFDVKCVQIDDLPMYNQDLDDEGRPPVEWTRFRQEVQALRGFLFVTPEYNRSVTPLLKNALDVGSRPFGKSVWNAKPGAIMSISPSAMGGFGANHHLRQCMVFLNIFMLQQPEVYLSNVQQYLDEKGQITNEKTSAFLKSFAESFAGWVRKLQP